MNVIAARHRSRMRVTLGVALAVWLAPGVAVEAQDAVVELPPMIVADKLRTKPWSYVAAPGYEVLSRASAANTRDVVEANFRLDHLLRLVLPPELQVRTQVPSPFLLTNEQETPTIAKDMVLGLDGTMKSRVRYLPNLALNDTDTRAAFALVDPAKFNAEKLTFARDRIAFVLERRVPALPRWFVVGFLELWEDMRFSENDVRIMPFTWLSEEERKNIREDPEYPRAFLPLHELLVWHRGRVPPEDSPAHATWRSQAALLVRWSLDGDPARRAALWKFVARSAVEPVNEALLRDCLGLDYAELRDRLSDYLPVAVNTPIRIRAGKMPPLPKLRLRDATPLEVARIKGEWERLVVRNVKLRHPEYVERYREQVERTFNEVTIRNSTDPQLLAVKGLYQCDLGDDAAALPLLEAAAQARVIRPRVYTELSRLRFSAARAALQPEVRLSPVEANRVLAPLAQARLQYPVQVETYLLPAEVWVLSRAELNSQNAGLMEEGLRLFPNHPLLLLDVAVLHVARGTTDEALRLVEHALAVAPPDPVRARLLVMKRTLQPHSAGSPEKGGL
jgi:hypothetical protein